MMDPLNQEIVEAFLNGTLPSDGFPHELVKVADLLHKVQGPATMQELTGENMVIQAFKASTLPTSSSGRSPKVLSKLLSTKAAAAAIAVALTGGGAAAVTGLIPVSFHHGLPSFTAQPTTTSPSTTTQETSSSVASTTSTLIPGENQGMASGKSLFGLCTAYSNVTGLHGSQATATTQATSLDSATTSTSSPALASTAFTQLQALAVAKGTTVAALCSTISNPGIVHEQIAQANSKQGLSHRPSTTEVPTTATTSASITTSSTLPQNNPSGNSIPTQANSSSSNASSNPGSSNSNGHG